LIRKIEAFWLEDSWGLRSRCAQLHHEVENLVGERLNLAPTMPGERFVLFDELAKPTQDWVDLRNQTLNLLMGIRDPAVAVSSSVPFYYSGTESPQYL
jgi:hypothetical protein